MSSKKSFFRIICDGLRFHSMLTGKFVFELGVPGFISERGWVVEEGSRRSGSFGHVAARSEDFACVRPPPT